MATRKQREPAILARRTRARNARGWRGDIRPLQRPETCVENVGTFCARPCSIKLPKMLNQQFSKDPDLSRGVVPRWSDNEDPAFSERIAIH